MKIIDELSQKVDVEVNEKISALGAIQTFLHFLGSLSSPFGLTVGLVSVAFWTCRYGR